MMPAYILKRVWVEDEYEVTDLPNDALPVTFIPGVKGNPAQGTLYYLEGV